MWESLQGATGCSEAVVGVSEISERRVLREGEGEGGPPLGS